MRLEVGEEQGGGGVTHHMLTVSARLTFLIGLPSCVTNEQATDTHQSHAAGPYHALLLTSLGAYLVGEDLGGQGLARACPQAPHTRTTEGQQEEAGQHSHCSPSLSVYCCMLLHATTRKVSAL